VNPRWQLSSHLYPLDNGPVARSKFSSARSWTYRRWIPFAFFKSDKQARFKICLILAVRCFCRSGSGQDCSSHYGACMFMIHGEWIMVLKINQLDRFLLYSGFLDWIDNLDWFVLTKHVCMCRLGHLRGTPYATVHRLANAAFFRRPVQHTF
jgi:hypothetical protein